jgi:DNA sulfur modification protein DndD
MLTLRSLRVEGFGPYADPADLEFPAQGVTVIYGDNMRGKTSLMNAIRFAFFGEVRGRGERTRGILSACNRDLAAQGTYGFSVDLSVTYEGQNYDVAREAQPKVAQPTLDTDFTSTEQLRRGGTVLGPAERHTLLGAMLPKGVARFFLFDGELLDQYAELLAASDEGRKISEAIEQILGVPILRNARDHLDLLKAKASRAKAAEASRHQKTHALGVAHRAATDILQAHIEERDRERQKLDELHAEREEIETELRRQEIYAVAVERLDKARRDLQTAEEAEATQRALLKVAMAEAWRTVLDQTVDQAEREARDAVAGALEALKISLRARAIQTGHCDTCDRDVPDETRARLRATVPGDTADDGAAMAALARSAALGEFERKDVRGEVRLIWHAMREAVRAQATARGAETDAIQTLDGRNPDELRRRNTTLTEIGAKIEASETAIRGHEAKIVEQQDAIDRLSKQIAKAGTPELASFEQREQVLTRAHTVFKDAVEHYKAELRGRVEATATKLFLEMTTEKQDYAGLAINEHYGLKIIHTDGREEDSRSAGAEQIVALALMGALQANAPLRGPIVMDTPFGRLDPGHTRNVVTTLPGMAGQVILFVQEGEISREEVREILGGHLKKEYQLDRQSARRTLVKEAQ